ncbi:uncharacterized protein TNIN_439101 [Trichonephila inaurata madagascariensis]|uniref:MULE transposase domain-containing protein n=1 Tax=Trichonephila inaurata madagascariensis TaxID=2747483 RepID=A0A8X6YPQ5_9ARAC|nr:uncharacterized protein TNIN_439101 [Trichonephila inaurata madagascariensis]
MQGNTKNPVLLYKPVGGEMDNYSRIDKRDFLLAIMNDAQEKLLELYGKNCVMIDSTHGTNQYNFQLTTLMVHDENHEGMPIATLFSSRVTTEILIPFFIEIKKRVPNFTTNVLMSDDTNSFPNAWKEAFGNDFKHLLCSWHVIRNWNSNARKWAYCYRNGLGINTNMKLERWHCQLKYEEAGGTIMKRLDKTISLLLAAIAKKLLSRVISIERGKLTSRVALIRKRHKGSEEMDSKYDYIQCDEKHIVTKSEGSSIFTYDILEGNRSCRCPIRCEECNICIHSFSCTCVDYCIRFVICKHIHFIQQKNNLMNSVTEDLQQTQHNPTV